MDAGMQIKELAGILRVTPDTVDPSSITALALSFTNLLFRFLSPFFSHYQEPVRVGNKEGLQR